MEEENKCDLI